MPFAKFDSEGACIAMSASQQSGFEETNFSVGTKIKKVDGVIREMTSDEITAEQTNLSNADNALDNRLKRDELLNSTDWVVTKALENGTTVSADWVTYRQALRDLPAHANWPALEDSDWPTSP